MVRRGYVTAFSVPAAVDPDAGRLVVVAERAEGTSRQDPWPAIEAIRAAVAQRHVLAVGDVRLLPAGAIPRTTSGKLARPGLPRPIPRRQPRRPLIGRVDGTAPARPRRWHPGQVGLLIRVAELLILVLPLVGATVAVVRAFGAQRRRTDEPAREVDGARPPEARAGADNQAARWRSIRRVLDVHSRTDERWLDYELDVAKLRADFLRPAKAEDLLDDPDVAAHYLAAVEDYVTAFNAAEAEATRRRRTDLSRTDQQRIARAQSLFRVAADPAAAAHERQRAYDVARHELEGLLVLPPATRANIERAISGEIEG